MILSFFRFQWKLKAQKFAAYGGLRQTAVNFFLAELSLHRAGITSNRPSDIPGVGLAEVRKELQMLEATCFPRIPPTRSSLHVETLEYDGDGAFSFKLYTLREATERLHELLVDMLREARRLEREFEEMMVLIGLAQPMSMLLHGKPEMLGISKMSRATGLIRSIESVTHIRVNVGAFNRFNNTEMKIEITGVWGETAKQWRKSGWNPDIWVPHPEQIHFVPSMNHASSKRMKTFYWNVLGVDNPAFGEVLLYYISEFSPTILILTETWVESAKAQDMIGKLGTGFKLLSTDGIRESGGVWLLFDPNMVSVVPLPGQESQFHCILIDKKALQL